MIELLANELPVTEPQADDPWCLMDLDGHVLSRTTGYITEGIRFEIKHAGQAVAVDGYGEKYDISPLINVLAGDSVEFIYRPQIGD